MKDHTMKDLEQELRRVADDVIKLVAEKNAQYGDAYFKLRDEWNTQSFCVRIGDKYYRLVNLVKSGQHIIDESIEDTIKDIMGYCMLELIYRESAYRIKG